MRYKNAQQKKLYFGYGSNVLQAQIARRCPHSRFLGAGRVKGYRLVFSSYSPRWKGGTAGILPQEGSKVWGAVYEMDAHCVRKLNIFEGMRFHEFHHKYLECEINGETTTVFTYVRRKTPRRERKPSYRYLAQILRGGAESGLPEAYLAAVEQYADGLDK
jgi:gamma-glutamylcyclotransferase